MRSRLCVLVAAAAACSSADVQVGRLAPVPGSPAAAGRLDHGVGAGAGGAPRWMASADATLEEATIVLHAGDDTLAVEHFSRTGRTLTARLVRPGHTLDYTLLFEPDGSVGRMEARITPDGASAPAERMWATFSDDSVQSRTLAGERTWRGGSALPPGTLPMVDASPALLELVVRQARRSGDAEAVVPVLVLGNPSLVVLGRVRFPTPDSALVTLGEATTRLHIDERGRILGGVTGTVDARFVRIPGGAARRTAAAGRSGAH